MEYRVIANRFGLILLSLFLALIVLVVFWQGLTGGFIFDDFPTLVSNARLHINSFTFDGVWKAAFSFNPGGGSRPLAMATFAVNFILGGLDPWGYKLGGLLVHCANVCLVFLLVIRVLILAGVNRHQQAAAFAIAALWAVHPMQVSGVLYVDR